MKDVSVLIIGWGEYPYYRVSVSVLSTGWMYISVLGRGWVSLVSIGPA